MKKVKILILILVILPAFINFVFADLTIERKTKSSIFDTVNRKKYFSQREYLKIKDGNIKIENITFKEILIIRVDRKLVWKIDTLKGTYSELSFEQIAKRKKEIMDEIKSTKNAVQGTEEEKNIDKILIDLGDISSDAKIEVKDIGSPIEIAGIKCIEKKVLVDNRVVIDGFFTEELKEGESYFKALSQIGAFPSVLYDKIASFKGLILKGDFRYTLFADRVTTTIETISISKDLINKEEFELPKELKKVPLLGFEEEPEQELQKPKEPRKDFYEDELDKESHPLR